MEDNKDNKDNNLPQSKPVINYGNKKLKFPQTESNFSINSNGGVQLVVEVGAPNVIKYEEAWRNEFVRERQESAKLEVNKPKPKYSKQKLTNVGTGNNFIPNHWGQLMDVTKIAGGGGVISYPAFVPTPPPGPCCMNDIYEHKSNSTFGMSGVGTYKWDATAGNSILPYGSTSPYVNGIWSYSALAGKIDSGQQYANELKLGNSGGRYVEWTGTVDYSNFRNLTTNEPGGYHQNKWGFPKQILKYLTGDFNSTGLQTNLDWSNSNMKYENNMVGFVYSPWFWYSFYNYYFRNPDIGWKPIKANAVPLYSEAPHLNPNSTNPAAINHTPFCQGRALIGAGVPHWPNPHIWSHTYPVGNGPNPDGKIENPRRLGWEGWVLRPHNVDWNWGNQGAFVDTLHYTLGCSEDASSSPTTGPNSYIHIDEWGMYHCKDGNNSYGPTVYDGKSCSAGYCYYPLPSIISLGGSFPTMPANQFYKLPHIDPTYTNVFNAPTSYMDLGGGSQLKHQRTCCSNSQWFQNARVLRQYSESTWNMIGSPFAGGNTGITYNLPSGLVSVDVSALAGETGLVGKNGNGPPPGQSDGVKYSCTTYYSLNRILQYISSPSDFEEILAKDFGTGPNGVDFSGNHARRIWAPVQSGYYNKNNPDINADDPWENMYRLRDVGKFYAMVNFCDDNARRSATNGYYGNLGNPPIAELNPINGEPESKLNPGIWPWGHCISYACGNPEYSINYQQDAGSYSDRLTYNKLGERGCEAQTPWASMPLNYYYSNITFSGIKVFFWDEVQREQTFKILPKWSFGNSNEWSGQVPANYNEASESAIGFMMWLGDRSWDYGVQSLDNEGNTLPPPLNNSGMPKSNSGGTAIEWWAPVDGTPQPGMSLVFPSSNFATLVGHFVYSLNDTERKASTNGYYKGIRPNFTYLDVVEHLQEMRLQFPLKIENPDFDYNNRPTSIPKYIAGVAIAGTEKVGNPQTGIPYDWWTNSNSHPNNDPSWNAFNWVSTPASSICHTFPGEGWTSFSNNNATGGNSNPNDPSWGYFMGGEGKKSGPGNPGGGNFCKQSVMLETLQIFTYPQTFIAHWGDSVMTPNCADWTSTNHNQTYEISQYLNGCFRPGITGSNNVSWPGGSGTNLRFNSGNIMGLFNVTCQCSQWISTQPAPTTPQLITGPHCEGCNVGCCTNEFNAVSSTLCEYVYPQGLFKSKDDCARVYRWEPVEIAFYVVDSQYGRRKTSTTPLGDTTFCKLRPQGVVGCIDPNALDFDPNATEDCSGSISHTYANTFTNNVNLNLNIDKNCCTMSETGYRCDQYNNGCHAVPNLWDVTTRAGSPNNGIFETMADCLVVFPNVASCSQELKKRFVKACPCGDPYIAPEHEVLTHKWIEWGMKPGSITVPPQIFHPYDETTYWGQGDITLRRGRLWWGTGNGGSSLNAGGYGNDPYSLGGGVQQGPITRQYQNQTWWRGISTSSQGVTWSWPAENINNDNLTVYQGLGRINWGVNGSNTWENSPTSEVEYQDCCLSHAYMYPGSKMFAGWITINGESPEPGQSFRPMEHISKADWQDDGNKSEDYGQSLNANVPYIVSYVADWEPNVNVSNVITNKNQVTQEIVGAFGMDVLEPSIPVSNLFSDQFFNSVNPSATNNGLGLAGWKRGQFLTSSQDFTFVACPNPSPAWSIYGQYGKSDGNTQFPKPAYQANPLGNCDGLWGASPNCSNAAGHTSALRPAPGTTNARMPNYDFQGNWTSFNQTYYHEVQRGSSWYQETHFSPDSHAADTYMVPNNKIQKIFAQPIHYAYHCAPPKWLWKDHSQPSSTENGWSGRPLAHPPARNTGGISRQLQPNNDIDIKGLPWYTGAMYSTGNWPWQIAWGKWLKPWVYAEGQNEYSSVANLLGFPDMSHQTFMGCYDNMEQLNQNKPTNVG